LVFPNVYLSTERVGGPVATTFKENDVISIVHIGFEGDVDQAMNATPIGSIVKVKCRLGFTLDDNTLSLTGEKVGGFDFEGKTYD
jgi:hypothetical protein